MENNKLLQKCSNPTCTCENCTYDNCNCEMVTAVVD